MASIHRKNITTISFILLASLLLSLLMTGFSQWLLNQSTLSQILSEGRRLTRTAAWLPGAVNAVELKKWSQELMDCEGNSFVAYVAVTAPSGISLAQAKRSEYAIPQFMVPETAAAWYTERRIPMPGDGREILEFTAPALNGNGDLHSFVTLGFWKPGFSLKKQAKTISHLVLFSIVWASAFTLMISRSKPVLSDHVLTRLQKILDGTATETEIADPIPYATGENANQLRSVLAGYWQKIKALEAENSSFQITKKVSLYTQKRFELILEEFPDGVMLLDESAVGTYANSKIEIFIGKPKEGIVGHKFHDWSQDEQLTDFFARFQNIHSRLRRRQEIIFSPRYLPGHTVSVGAYPVETRDHNTFLGTLVLFRDVTAEALAKQARGDFVAQVSHELKSPLNVLKMYSELLLGDEGNEEELRREAANVISDEVERLSLLINNLLSISKIEMGSISLQRQRVKILDLLTDAFQTVSRSGSGEGLTFNLELPNELSPLSLDKDLFRVALNNLLTNAIKYNRPQGTVTLAAEETETQIIMAIKDTGLGIADHDQEHIFEKFYRSQCDEVREKPGHGLGLSLASNIIEVHQGKLKLESTLGEGSTFSIIFEKGAGLVQEGL